LRKKEMKRATNFLIVAILLLGMVSITQFGCKGKEKEEAPEEITITLGTGVSAEDTLNALHRAIISAARKHWPGLEIVSVENPGGTAEVIENIERYELCGISVDEAAQAYYGFYRWQEPHPSLRLVWIVGNIRLALLVANDTGIKSVSELEGEPFGGGDPGSMVELKTKKLFEALDITPEWSEDSWSTQIELYRQGELVGFVATSNPPAPGVLECAAQRPYTILTFSESELNSATQHYMGTGLTYPSCEIRPGTYPGQEEMITTYGLLVGYFASKDVPADVIFRLSQHVWEEAWAISGAYVPLKFDILGLPKLTLEQGPFPLHPGLIQFYRALGLTVPSHLLPPELK
jgi:TRAP transporter TAXI family solute receptor